MKILKITARKKLSDKDVAKLEGTLLDENSYDRVIRQDADVVTSKGKLLLRFRKDLLSINMITQAFYGLKGAAKMSDNRGTAGGKITKADVMVSRPALKPDNIRISTNGTRYQYRTANNGKWTTTTYGKKIANGVAGYMDRYPRIPYCRLTAYTQQNFKKFAKAYPLIKTVDTLYHRYAPSHYRKQRAIADKTSQDFVIKDTSFTTITVNKNFQTAVHKDAGDFKKGFGNLVVIREGLYDGSFIVLPQYRIAVDVQNCDVLFMDVHHWHGNTPARIISPKPFTRLSLVMYYRENMFHCGNKKQELTRARKGIRTRI